MDVEVSLDITANEFIVALKQGLALEIDIISQRYLKFTNTIAILKANKILEEYGIHTRTEIWYER